MLTKRKAQTNSLLHGFFQDNRRIAHDKDKLEGVIASLEGRQALNADGIVPAGKRRGRKSMSPEERREVSARLQRECGSHSGQISENLIEQAVEMLPNEEERCPRW